MGKRHMPNNSQYNILLSNLSIGWRRWKLVWLNEMKLITKKYAVRGGYLREGVLNRGNRVEV